MDTPATTVRQTGTSAGTARVLTEARVWMASPTTTARVHQDSQGFDARSMLTSAPLTHVKIMEPAKMMWTVTSATVLKALGVRIVRLIFRYEVFKMRMPIIP